jgi:hypothetical protein
MARFTQAGGSGSGGPGPRGPQGPAGDSAYDIAVANGFVGTEQEWLESVGDNADIADFTFTLVDGDESVMNIHNHDMRIETTRDGNQDSDISINSADDIWITANDEIEISSTTDSVTIYTNDFNTSWEFNTDGGLRFPDSTTQTTAYTGDDLVLPQDLGTTDSPTFNKITLTSNNGQVDNITVGDDAFIGDANIANHVAIIGNQDTTTGGIILGNGLTETLYSDGSNLSVTAENDIVLNPGSTYAYIGTPQLDGSNRIAKMSDIQGGGTDNHGDFYFNQTTLRVDSSSDMILEANEGDSSVAAQIKIGAGDVPIDIAAYDRQDNWFYTSDWSTAEWQSYGEGQGQVVITGMTNLETFLNDQFNGEFRVITINGDYSYPFENASWGGGNATIYVPEGPSSGFPTTVETITLLQSLKFGMSIDLDEGRMDILAPESDIYVQAGDDLYLTARQDDVHIRANDDIRFTANYSDSEEEYYWRMDSEGEFHLPGNGLIWNPSNSSGDGSGNDTIHLVPSDSDNETEQRIIIDPTGPNHIHLRAGGVQDYSTADLILGGERAGVRVSDTDGTTVVQSKKEDYSWSYQNVGEGGQVYVVATAMAEPDYNDFTIISGQKYVITNVIRDEQNGTTSYETTPSIGFAPFENYTFTRDNGNHVWNFNRAGYLNGPTETGYLRVTGIINDDGNLEVQADQNLIISGGESNGEFLHDSSDPANQIATIGDVSAGRFGASASFYSTVDQGPSTENTIQAFTFNSYDWATGVTLGNLTEVTMTNAGKYNIAFSAQMHQTNGSGIVNIWLNKNGTPLENSNTKFAITANNPYSVAALNLFVNANAGDYYELMWSSDSNHTVMEYEAPVGSGATLHPAVPSIILTVNQVG